MKLVKAYKWAIGNKDGYWVSLYANPPLQCEYRLNHITVAPIIARERGFHLTAFERQTCAEEFGGRGARFLGQTILRHQHPVPDTIDLLECEGVLAEKPPPYLLSRFGGARKLGSPGLELRVYSLQETEEMLDELKEAFKCGQWWPRNFGWISHGSMRHRLQSLPSGTAFYTQLEPKRVLFSNSRIPRIASISRWASIWGKGDELWL